MNSKPKQEIRMEPDDDDVIDWEDLMSQWRHNWKIDLFSAWQILGDWAILLCLSMGTAKLSDVKMKFSRNVESSKSFFENGSPADAGDEANSANNAGYTTRAITSDNSEPRSW